MRDIRENTVTQDNALVSASYSMTLDEKRLLLACISKLDPESKAWREGRAEAEMNISEWRSLYASNSKAEYSQIRKAAQRLYERSVRIYGDSKKGKEIRWISAWEYDEGAGRVALTFSGPILYYLTGMVDEFTKFDLLGVCGLKSVHSVRLYELASQFKGTGWRQVSLDDLRIMFDLGETYQRWIDLKKRVIDRACKEVTAKSDLEVSYEIVKRGRSVHAIRLKIEPKEQLDLF